MVALAKLLNVKEFHYVGTSYIAGKLVGTAIEDNPLDSGFNNPYEESKYKAEMLVRASGIPFSVYRPAIITGRRSDGRIRKPLAFYRILEFMAKLKSNKCAKMGVDPRENIDLDINFSAVPSEHIYFVPIDYVQEAITALFQKPVCNRAYHITGDSPISNKQIQLAIGNALNISGITVDPTQDGVGSNANMMSRLLGDLLPYFSSDIVFDQSNVRKALGDEILDWEYGVKSLEALVKSFYVDHFSDTDWIQDLMKR